MTKKYLQKAISFIQLTNDYTYESVYNL